MASGLSTYILEFDDSKKRWELNKRGAGRAVRVEDRLVDIESVARQIARNNAPSELRIEQINGAARERIEYDS